MPVTSRSYSVKYRDWLFKLPLARRYRGTVLGRTTLFKDGEGGRIFR